MSPVDRPLASSSQARRSRVDGGSSRLVPMQDRRPSGRLSPRQAALVAERLSERDLEVLRLVGRLRLVSGAQLARLFWFEGNPSTRARLARRGLARLADLEVLERLPRRVGGVRAGSGGLVFTLGRVGQRLLQEKQRSQRRVRRAYAPGPRYQAHALSITELYVSLVEAQRQGLATLLAFDPEPACWRSYPGRYGARLVAKPDAYLRLGVGEFELSWFIEIDLASEALVTLARKGRTYLDLYRSGVLQATDGVFPRIAWIAPDVARAQVITGALARIPEHPELYAVTTNTEAGTLLRTEASS
jgi:hypothetical protein